MINGQCAIIDQAQRSINVERLPLIEYLSHVTAYFRHAKTALEGKMKTVDYLNLAKKRLGITSNYALAKKLDITQSGISLLMSGKNTMGDDTALKLAAILGREPLELLAAANRERAKTPETAAIWANLADRVSQGFRSLSLLAKTGRRFALPR